ncbi:hypothetical protein D3C72_2601790 [compost metagenome]
MRADVFGAFRAKAALKQGRVVVGVALGYQVAGFFDVVDDAALTPAGGADVPGQ